MQNIEKLRTFTGTLLSPFIVIWFWIKRYLIHCTFLFRARSAVVRVPLYYYPFAFINMLLNNTVLSAKEFYLNYCLKEYTKFIPQHYSLNGMGYRGDAKLSEEEKAKKFQTLKGRISHYLSSYPQYMDYTDGDSILDLGCGRGENIRFLIEHFPHSRIHGVDISKSALGVLETGTKENTLITSKEGSITDIDLLKSYPDGSYDHVVISHVFSFIIRNNVEQTQELRKEIVNQLIRICKKNVMIMDGHIMGEPYDMTFFIEHKYRGVFREPILKYFLSHSDKGTTCIVGSVEAKSNALLFTKQKSDKCGSRN